ncbi:MAG: hypothetical protein ACXACF_07525 [Candidatus Hermodarchaeia archaeon]
MDESTGVQALTLSTPKSTRLEYWFNAHISELDDLFEQANQLTRQHFDNRITLFNPGSQFPAVSITGNQCQLNCQHCRGHFLQQMQAITHPNDLLTFCQDLAQRKGVGCLISGGCDSDGNIPLSPFLPILSEIKQTTNLFLNVHTGFLTNSEVIQLARTGIDCTSVDIVGDETTLHTIYGLTHRSTTDYATTLKALNNAQLPVAPHICVGLNHGQLTGELAGLQLIHSILQPTVLVIIALMPTQGTPMANSPPVNPLDVARICALSRLLFPECEIALGCMRPRGAVRRELEQLAIHAGVTRLVLPTKTTIQYLQQNGYTIRTKNACCVV